jgi:hypothetical protein
LPENIRLRQKRLTKSKPLWSKRALTHRAFFKSDRKIYQKFEVENDKIVITISNRGLRLADKKAVEIKPEEGRRGWGFETDANADG